MLLSKNVQDLAAQAMHESGNLHYHYGNLRAAYKWWTTALELIMGADDVIHSWRDLFKDASDISAELLQRCGIWGCVLAAILTSNIAQYVYIHFLKLYLTARKFTKKTLHCVKYNSRLPNLHFLNFEWGLCVHRDVNKSVKFVPKNTVLYNVLFWSCNSHVQ